MSIDSDKFDKAVLVLWAVTIIAVLVMAFCA